MAREVEELVCKIERAFAHRVMPAEAVDLEENPHVDSDVEDALWFSGKACKSIRLADWKDHMCAFTFMSAEAAAYYLPSLLVVSTHEPSEWIYSLDSLMIQLDRSPDSWDEYFKRRFLGFRLEEYGVLKEWLLYMSKHAPDLGFDNTGLGESCARALATVELLQQETELLNLIQKEEMDGRLS